MLARAWKYRVPSHTRRVRYTRTADGLIKFPSGPMQSPYVFNRWSFIAR